jgi:hypothetical protein
MTSMRIAKGTGELIRYGYRNLVSDGLTRQCIEEDEKDKRIDDDEST